MGSVEDEKLMKARTQTFDNVSSSWGEKVKNVGAAKDDTLFHATTKSEKYMDLKECVEPNVKNIREGNHMADIGLSLGTVNGTSEKREKHMRSDRININDLDNEEGKADADICRAMKEEHVDAGKDGPVDAAKHNCSSHVATGVLDFGYPDTEFCTFEEDKSIDKFQPGQIWALYNDVDGLPKYYGKIMKVASTDFEVEINWLDVCCQPEVKGRWPCEELPVGCGKFLLSQKDVSFNTPTTFSHQVKAWTSSNSINIYPSIDQIWALYKNLRMDWTPEDMKNCEYELVRILDDTVANNTAGFKVMILEKVGGYNSVFRDSGNVKEILQNDFLSFSHEIPVFLLSGERDGKLRGYFELDSAAVPTILFCPMEGLVSGMRQGPSPTKLSPNAEKDKNAINRDPYYKDFVFPFVDVQDTQWRASSGDTKNHSAIPQSNFGYSCSTGSWCVISDSVLKKESSAMFAGRSQSKTTEYGGAAKTWTKSEEDKLEEVNEKAQNQKRVRSSVIEECSESYDTDSSNEDVLVIEENDLAKQTVETTSKHHPRRSMRQKHQVTYIESGSDDEDIVNHQGTEKVKRSESLDGSDYQSDEFSDGCANETGRSVTRTAVFRDTKNKQRDGIPSEGSLPNANEQVEAFQENGKQRLEHQKKVESFTDEHDSEENSSVDLVPEPESVSYKMTYAEPEFTDFDKDRTECFAVDQIWATYDGNGCMPRYYARIKKILSEKSKVEIVWLEHDPDPDDRDVLDWVEVGLPIACGIFKNGSKDQADFSSFSHLVSWQKGRARGTYMIYPRKGDIWALFKDWSISWCSDPELHREYKFEFVEVLSDYDERIGVKVAYLVKLKGFVSLFYRSRNKGKNSFEISPKKLLRFSHRIPFQRMTGKERENVPVGSYELDPASVPSSNVEEVEYISSKSFDDLVVDVECMDARIETDFDRCEAPKTYIKLNEKSIHERNHVNDRGTCHRGTNGASGKKTMHINRKRNVDDSKEGKESKNKCGAKKLKHLDTDENAAENFTLSPAAGLRPYPVKVFYMDRENSVFEAAKSKDKFQTGQIWALYCDVDCLPKFYGRIKRVSSRDFEVEITWLGGRVLVERAMQWSSTKLPTACGEFFLSTETETYNTPKHFSHRVLAAEDTSKKTFGIYPIKGQVWALYKNLSPDWTCEDMEHCDYNLVRVLENTDAGSRVVLLEKVDDHISVFKASGFEMEIKLNEYLKFSHQILAEEIGGQLRGYLELDPAAVPPMISRYRNCTCSRLASLSRRADHIQL